ncbi:MAG: dipeptide ABC transporter ATP-binding protein [Candidatus Carbobacillus altaicus]|nr:dipeptide ABC transporter ATP-binding protein [Candidatus Carbobacillus altaicus]
MPNALLEVKNVSKYFPIQGGLLKRPRAYVRAIERVSFQLQPGETLGVVGESGSGKSTLGRTIIRLYDPTEGAILYQGHDLARLNQKALRPYRRHIQMVFQDPYASLNPRMTIGALIEEPLKLHTKLSRQDRQEEVRRLLKIVGLSPDAHTRYPHEFSGGQRQRIGIARALSIKPSIIIADEPVSALDVSIQAQVINLMMALRETFNLAYIFIAHDLSVVKHISDRVMVMYLGHVVELADKKELFRHPLHPYTEALLFSVPEPNPHKKKERIVLSGDIPSAANPPQGCVFHTRCPKAMNVCKEVKPVWQEVSPRHWTACHLHTKQ